MWMDGYVFSYSIEKNLFNGSIKYLFEKYPYVFDQIGSCECFSLYVVAFLSYAQILLNRVWFDIVVYCICTNSNKTRDMYHITSGS